jgi:hypothetical protein
MTKIINISRRAWYIKEIQCLMLQAAERCARQEEEALRQLLLETDRLILEDIDLQEKSKKEDTCAQPASL